MKRLREHIPLRTAALYIVVATLWIVFCDAILLATVKQPAVFAALSTPQAILIVGMAALIVYMAFVWRDLITRVRYRSRLVSEEHRATRRGERLDALWRLAVHPNLDYSEQAAAVMAEGAAALGLDLAAIGHVENGDKYVYDFTHAQNGRWEPPKDLRLAETLAFYAVQKDGTVAWNDLTADPKTAANYQVLDLGLRAYVGTPFVVEGRTYVLGFGSTNPLTAKFDKEDFSYMELLAAFFARLVRQRTQEAQITKLAFHDSLTGLANRARFLDWLEELIPTTMRRERQFALLFIDIDRFKEVNDATGHAGGDEVLTEIAKRLQTTVRADDILARLGGDEFGVLMPDIDSPADAQRLAQRIRAATRPPFTVKDRKFYLSASVGIAMCPADGSSPAALMDKADAAAYQAKQQGRDRERFFSVEIAASMQRRQQLVSALRSALDTRDFLLYYQPQIEIATGSVIGAEALLRLRSEGTIVYPADFLETAEDSGLMLAIGNWVLREGLRRAKHWSQLDRRLRLAINISARQLEDPNFSDDLRLAISEIGADPAGIALEITESVAMKDPFMAASLLRQCKHIGLQVAIDDFGTHYSSLAYLKHIDADVIKIDKLFTQGLPTDSHDAAIVRAIITLAANLRRSVIAEGVENPDQLQWLKSAGCFGAQGIWIAPPMPADDFDAWLGDWQAPRSRTTAPAIRS